MVSLLLGTLWWHQWGRFLEDARGRQRPRRSNLPAHSLNDFEHLDDVLITSSQLTLSPPLKARFPQNVPVSVCSIFLSIAPQENVVSSFFF